MTTFGKVMGEGLSPAVDLLFPPRCPLCGGAIAQQKGVCGACWGELAIPGHPSCATCQRPFSSDTMDDGAICAACLADPPRHDGIAAGTLYNDASRQLVLSFKHGRRIALAPMLARLIAARLPPMDETWLIVPVPLHRWRLWARGFNQAALLAGELGKLIGAPALHGGLVRRKRTPTLGGLGRKARERALSGTIAISSRHEQRFKGAKVLLVDDVRTSGATSDACTRVLKRAGAETVVIGCFARVLDEAL